MTLIDELVESHTRRELALKGGTNAPIRYVGPIAGAEPSRDRPTLLWPDGRHLIPRHCHHCGAGNANFDIDPPYGAVRHGDVRCLVCSRTIVLLRDAGTQSSPGRSVPVVVDPPKRQRLSRYEMPCIDGCARPGPSGGPCSTCRTRRVREREVVTS
jgi:hypothetical protein